MLWVIAVVASGCSTAQLEEALAGIPSSDIAAASPTTLPVSQLSESQAKANAISSGTLVTASWDRPGETDEYLFEGREGEEVKLFFEGLAGQFFTRLELLNPTGNAVLQVLTYNPHLNGSLETNFTPTYQLLEDGTFMIRASSDPPSGVDSSGPYRFALLTVDRSPETLPISVSESMGIVAGEAIDYPGDIDEFEFLGADGDEITIAFQALSGEAWTASLEILPPDGERPIGVVQSRGDSPALDSNTTSTVSLDREGIYKIRIDGGPMWNVGPYRFEIRPQGSLR